MGQAVMGLVPANIVLAAVGIPEFRLGAVGGQDDVNAGYKEYMYGKAAAAITLGDVCVESTGNVMQKITTANTAAGQFGHGSRVAVAMATMAVGDFGWFQIYGKSSSSTLAAAAKGTRMNTTATGGALDDDGTAASRAINGITLGTATGGAPAVNADTILCYPTVGDTL